jgi:DNA repair protein RecO (recombination protein O)
LVLRRVPYRDSDLVISLFTETLGAVSALARGARKSQKRFGGALEPMHTLNVQLEESSSRELLTLSEASIATARRRLVSDLDRMQAAGRALGWVRRAAPQHTPEPAAWRVLAKLLDRLDDRDDQRSAMLHLSECGLRLLAAFGWGIDFERCVVSGVVCEPGRAAMVDPVRGGLVSRACGGARITLDGALRGRLAHAAAEQPGALVEADAELALSLVEEALRAHAGMA